MTKARELSDYTGLAADITAAGLPSTVAGSEMTWATATVPTGWLEENGAAISRSTYSALFAVLGTTFGVGDGSSTFNLPDARGEFIRGWAHGSANDPDRAARTNRGDGTTGDVVGSKQLSENKAHTHTYADFNNYANSATSSQTYRHHDAGQTKTTNSTGGNESRPRNTNRMIIIKY
jgi:microcystin-dependent protein